MKAYAETTLFSKEKNNSVETAKELPFQSQAEEENFPIIVRLEDDASGNKKHLHYGIHSNDGTGFISKGGLTSAFDFCKATGNPRTIKISHIKADGSFIKTPL